MHNKTGEIEVVVGPGPEHDTVVKFPGEPAGSFWATIDPGPGRPMFSLGVTPTDEGIVVSIYAPHGEMEEPLASTYVYDQEVIDQLVAGLGVTL